MLNIPRLRDVLKKLETTSDLARNLIKRASVVIDGNNNNNNTITINNKEHGAMISSSSFADKPLDLVTSCVTTSSTLASQFNTLTKIATPGTNEIKMMMYNNNNKNNTEHEIHQPQLQQPKTIRAALFNASLFSRAVSNGSRSGCSTISLESHSNSQNLREENALKHNQSFESSRNNMSETKLKEDVVVMMTQQEGETITKKQLDDDGQTTTTTTKVSCNGASCGSGAGVNGGASGTNKHDGKEGKEKPCFNSSLADILHFMELVGNLKHTKRTGWVLRDVDDCESISGHMYRMSMMTFLLEETEGLNRIRCMELALVHDLAESLVGDLTPFCGVAKEDKKAMELKAMADICKLVEPRGKRIMELFEEYEEGQSAESKFVKDLDRLDMVMQAFEYEKRDNCLMKHQEFFDSTEGKFQHPFIKKLVKEICDQRKSLVEANVIAKGELNLKTVTPNCPPCLEHKMEHKNERS